MSAPTPVTRRLMLERDGGRCAACGRRDSLEAQHRRAVGMGGSKKRPVITDLLTLCARDNARCESDLQDAALRFGWKVRRHVDAPGLVPVWYAPDRAWFRLTLTGHRVLISVPEAKTAMDDVYGPEFDGSS